mgnify:CR=1 FL=1
MKKEHNSNEVDRIKAMYDRGDINGAENRCNELLQIYEKEQNPNMVMQLLGVLVTICTRSARYTEAEEIALQLIELAQQNSDENILQKAYNSLGVIYYYTNRYDDAYLNYNKALAIVKNNEDRLQYASILTNIANLESTMGKMSESIERYIECIAIAQYYGDTRVELGAQINLGQSYAKLGYYADGLEHSSRALHLAQELGNKMAQSSILHTFGVLYINMGDYLAAENYLMQAATINEELNNISWLLRNKTSLANIEVVRGNFEKALEIEKEIETKTVALGEPEQLADVRCNIARTLIRLHRYAEAENILLNIITQAGKFPQKTSYIHSMLGTIYSAENSSLYDSQKAIHYLNKSITESDEKHDMQDLTPYKLLAEVYDREGNVIESLTLLKRYITMTESKITDKEKELAEKMKSEKNIRKKEIETQLLTNIAPESIVNRMMNREKIADYFSSVSIIFIDIVNFTSLSQSIEPELLLEFLNTVFSAFDECAARYGVEKIKTIGDAYMAVAGIPKWTPDHAQRAANFACAILSLAPNIHSPVEGIPLSLRIGIACGEAIAGIIGTKRLSYDLWGDAVNTASRMESHGEAGKIHVSEEFVLALSLNRPSDTFSHWEKDGMRAIPRGEMDIKGKGMMKTYFLEKVSEP